MSSEADPENDRDALIEQNKQLLSAFADWLAAAGLKHTTIRQHCSNIDFYVNHYLLYYDAVAARDGSDQVAEFLGDWFIRKAMWSNAASIKSNAASLKKFYTFLSEQGMVEPAALANLKTTIKQDMPDWLASMQRYMDLAEDAW
ncbi:MAG: recombinase [Thiohalocapsa sp.]